MEKKLACVSARNFYEKEHSLSVGVCDCCNSFSRDILAKEKSTTTGGKVARNRS
jgi:hypothetical protein